MNTLCNKAQRILSVFLFISILSFSLGLQQVSAQADGAKLYKQNCATCHRTDEKPLTGPGLAGVFDRVPKPAEEWLIKWIRSNSALRASGDKYANDIYEKYNKVSMTEFDYLSDEEIKAILDYVKNPPVDKPLSTTPTDQGPVADQPKGVDPFWTLVAILAFLIVLIAVLRGVKRSLKNVMNERAGKSPLPERGMWGEVKAWMGSNKRLVAVIVIALLAIGSKAAWDGMFGIGVYTGYKPSQPIAFSHKIHAGDNGINCVYCHSTAEKSRHAGIPSANICMNCHKGITEGPTTGTAEIAKIYDAVGWDAEKMEYNKPQKPIEWVKVHNLPDFVYFSHQQHVVVGKQECQTCHGDVASMTVAEQHSPLTMRWCIDCHRQTEVAMESNPYYEELHAKLAKKYEGQKITVDKMGGIECARCHY